MLISNFFTKVSKSIVVNCPCSLTKVKILYFYLILTCDYSDQYLKHAMQQSYYNICHLYSGNVSAANKVPNTMAIALTLRRWSDGNEKFSNICLMLEHLTFKAAPLVIQNRINFLI